MKAKLQKSHGVTAGAFKRIETKRQEKGRFPRVKGLEKASFFFVNEKRKRSFWFRSIDTVITDHFEMLFRDVNNKLFNKLNSMESLNNENIVLMSVVMESNIFTIIGIDVRRSNNRSAKITTDIFENISIACDIGFSIDIETMIKVFVEHGFDFFKGLT